MEFLELLIQKILTLRTKQRKMNPPVIIFAYNRARHLQRLVDSLLQNPECVSTDLYIFADGERTPGDPLVKAVSDTIDGIKGFKSINVTKRNKNIGLASNIIDGVTSTINLHGEAIVLEDDLVVTPIFLRYMRDALNYYKDTKAFSIAGYTPPVDIPNDYKHDTYAIMRNCSWGWATWKDRWMQVDWDVKDFDKFFADDDAVRQFNNAGNDLSTMLYKQQKGQINSWSIRFCYASFLLQMPTIYPVRSLVTNGGADGSGSNVGSTSKYNTTTFDSDKNSFDFCSNLEINQLILKSFRRTYDTSLQRRIINYAKRMAWKVSH